MPQYVALLRGINVGGHRVKMDHLRTLFQALGFKDVSTVIASGNVIFSTESEAVHELRDAIEDHLMLELGYEVATFLRTPAELAAITADAPIESDARGRTGLSHYVMFLQGPAPASLRSSLACLNSDTDDFQFSGSEVHWRIQGKLSDSPLFGAGFDRATRGVHTTMRNMNTVRRMIAKTSPPPAT
jgi:uncharacterized protein (DUF1697 family)